ncbi:MAG TPA: acetamidase/formamidase family protein [Rhodopila sp.]|jgi:acetamidase/formamidase/AraC-like DNA-binding protein|nr:acetamidase/formamidase family protein [Rhodopila sp.]
MAVSRFSTDPFPLDRCHAAWAEALRGIDLAPSEDGAPPRARLLSHRAPRGSEFLLVITDSPALHCLGKTRRDTLLLGFLLSGTARLEDGAALSPRDVLCWPATSGPLLRPEGQCRLLLLRLPRRDPRWGGLGEIIGDDSMPLRAGNPPVLSGLLAAVAEALESGTETMLSTLESALAEIMPAVLGPLTGGSAQHAALRQRILAAIERQLPQPHLNLARFATEEGLSERAVQKLLESEGRSFSQYLRHRRLGRAAEALQDPALAALSVSEIGFRCGFEDPAHFSRAFRQRFGTTPAQHRAQAEPKASPAGPRSRGRPQPGGREQAAPPAALPAAAPRPEGPMHHHLRATPETVHWGYFSRSLAPALTLRSGDTVTVETLTQHASDDAARMIAGDADAEAVFQWTAEYKSVDRRGAGPLDASIYGRGAGEGFGVHILTGPIAVEGARPRDVLEVEILEITPRPSRAPGYEGKSFGSNAAVWWGRHYDELLTGARPREVVTLYEILTCGNRLCAHAAYSFRWTPQRDPFGVLHPTIDYPGVPVDPSTIERNARVLSGVHVPVRPHFGTIGLAPDHPGPLDSVPPSAFGGNIDNWRLGPGTRIFLPVSVLGALLSLGDPHAAQGDGEVSGTAIECSMTGRLRLVLHPRETAGPMLRDLSYPLIETEEHWIVQGFSHPDYLADFGDSAQSEVYKRSSLDAAMKDAFRKARRFLMTAREMSEDEAVSLLSVAVDFGITQVVDGNWGVHAAIPKALFTPPA